MCEDTLSWYGSRLLSFTLLTVPIKLPSLARPRGTQCKHLLAVRLAPHMGRLEEQEVGEDAFESYCGLSPTV